MTVAPPVEEVIAAYSTPKGNTALMTRRSETSDHNSIYSCMTEDEYGLASLNLTGVALDIGAHLGGVTVGLALDNPELRVIAVEALSANARLLQENVERNGVSDRVTVLHAIAGKKSGKGTVRWNFDQDESGQHHRFIANAHLVNSEQGEFEEADIVTLADLGVMAGEPIVFAKIDCEGGEYDFLDTASVGIVQEVRGEYHQGWDRLVALLEATHDVQRVRGTDDFGGFHATRKAT